MPRTKTSQSASEQDEPISVAVSDADAASPARRKPPAKPASPAELAQTLRRAVGSGSVLLAQVVGVPDVAMSADEARDIADPLARILAHSKLLKNLTRRIANSSDWLDLAFASAMYSLRIYPLVYAKLEENAARERVRRAQPTSPLYQQQSSASASSNGASADSANGSGLDSLLGWHPGAEPLEGWATGYAG